MRLLVIVGAALASWALVIGIVIAAMSLTGCEDRAYPLDCAYACGHRLATNGGR